MADEDDLNAPKQDPPPQNPPPQAPPGLPADT